ncbi:MAG: FtsX-like permease family protein [Bacillota bacterium]|nr:FtsX-like permease family protein [Bacillota bacterium]
MSIILKIAFRNLILNRKRFFLIGSTIFLSSLMLLVSSAAINGVQTQILKSYINLQSGHITIVREEMKKVSDLDPMRLLFLKNGNYDPEKFYLDEKAQKRLNDYVDKYKDEIKAFFPSIRGGAQLITDDISDAMLSVYGLSEDNAKFLTDTQTVSTEEGKLLSDEDYSICICKEKAVSDNLKLGDKVKIGVVTHGGKRKELAFTIRGIYSKGAGYDAFYGFVSEKNARELFEAKQGYFDTARIYMKDINKSVKFAGDLDKYLMKESNLFRAESYFQASAFYTNLALILKTFFTVFIIILLCIIAVGLRSSIRMNLYERMKEFGTIRSIGYSRLQSFFIIFMEIFLLALIFLFFAFVISFVLILILGNTGINVGSGPMSYAMGGEIFYPEMKPGDVLFALAAIIVFVMASTIGPGLKLCYQNITDIMMKRQKRVYLTVELARSLGGMIKGIFTRSKMKSKGLQKT